jgi:hypothetical protein
MNVICFFKVINTYFEHFLIFKRLADCLWILILCYFLVMTQKYDLAKNLLAFSDLGCVDQEAANGFAYVATW